MNEPSARPADHARLRRKGYTYGVVDGVPALAKKKVLMYLAWAALPAPEKSIRVKESEMKGKSRGVITI